MEKPILFNTEMVQAILKGRKTQTRRIIKKKYDNTHIEWFTNKYGTRLIEKQNNVEGETFGRNPDGTSWQKLLGYRELYPPYKVDDILWVRETWSFQPCSKCNGNCDTKVPDYFNEKGCYVYRTNYGSTEDDTFPPSMYKWHPSIHMPRKAARIFLKVTDVKVQRVQDITEEGALKEGINHHTLPHKSWEKPQEVYGKEIDDTAINAFRSLWNKIYNNWNENPWVWVIEFERVKS